MLKQRKLGTTPISRLVVNGGEMRPIHELADIIASGMPLEKASSLRLAFFPKSHLTKSNLSP